MAGRLLFAGLIATALVFFARAGEAAEPQAEPQEEEDSRPLLAMGAGAATSFLSFMGGTIVVARADSRAERNAGLLGAQAGLTLSPIVAHALVGELGRGAVFALIPLAAEVLTGTLMAFYPRLITSAPPAVQYATFGGVTASIVGSTIGVVDAANVRERHQAGKLKGLLQGLSVSAVLD